MTVMFVGASASVVVSAFAYVVIGALHDVAVVRRQQRMDVATENFAAAIFGTEEQAAEAVQRLANLRRAWLAHALVSLVTDLGGDASARLRRVAAVTGIARHVRRLARSRWRRRARAAQLLALLPADDPVRAALLEDRHPVVRARAAETLGSHDALVHAQKLLELLADDNPGVRLAAQQALLRCDARLVDPLTAYLADDDAHGTVMALEVAAHFPDPALDPYLLRHVGDDDAVRRMLVARAVGASLTDSEEAVGALTRLLDDPDGSVRSAAATAVGRLGVHDLFPKLGATLGDEAWEVRRAAGAALAGAGPIGAMLLRVHLDSEDRFARDMARQMLDVVAAREGGALDAVAPIEVSDEAPLAELWAS